MANPGSAPQLIVFTAMPNGINAGNDTVRVSVLLSPRLSGGTTLAAYPDFLLWPRKLQTGGAQLTLQCNGTEHTAQVPTGQLRPDLWELLFTPDTPVASHAFDDYTKRLVISYPARQALVTVKSLYQIASGTLALPSEDGGHGRKFQQLTDGLQVFWNEDLALQERNRLRHEQQAGRDGPLPAGGPGPAQLGGDGLPTATAMPPPGVTQDTALRFSLFHHMPAAPNMTRPPLGSVLDFHKVVSSLTAYPALMRALGLVIDVELPSDAVPGMLWGNPGKMSVTDFVPGNPWRLQTQATGPATAYIHTEDTYLGSAARMFVPAPVSGQRDYGLLDLGTGDFTLSQLDVDGALHKTITLAETAATAAPALHPKVFDPTATLPALRSAGLSLLADNRAQALLAAFKEAKAFNDALETGGPYPRPLFAEDLVRGYRLDVWDSASSRWHSLHRRTGAYSFGDQASVALTVTDEEGFTQLAVTQPAPDPTASQPDDLYLPESVARWNGWSLSVRHPGTGLSRSADPGQAIAPDDPENAPATPFKMATTFTVTPGSLPRLRFGRQYRIRARLVDLAGNSLAPDDPRADELSAALALPQVPDGMAYLRYEPVAAPSPVLRDPAGVTGPGSAIDRLVIRTYNNDPSQDTAAPDLTANDRHLLPPRSSVEMLERHGLLDDPVSGAMMGDQSTHDLLAARDAGNLQTTTLVISGQAQTIPLEPGPAITALPYLPDPLGRGAALRDLPGTPDTSIGTVQQAASPGTGTLTYDPLPASNPRPGSVTLIDFDGDASWQQLLPFRLALEDGTTPPAWDDTSRALTVYLPKGATAIVPLSSYMTPGDLKLMGIWQWLREYSDAAAQAQAEAGHSTVASTEELTYIVQRAVEGGHWMLTPPHILTLIHAVQQPIGRPQFTALRTQHPGTDPSIQTEDESGPTRAVAFDPVAAWRALGAVDAYLTGGLRVHGASTGKLDLIADWDDPADAGTGAIGMIHQSAHVDEIPLPSLNDGYLQASGPGNRLVGRYESAQDIIWFYVTGDELGGFPPGGAGTSQVAAPRHYLNDTKHHVVRYRAVASSRYRDCFPADSALDFTRTSAPVTVDVPCSARPAAPRILKVLPTFGWDRQVATNLKSSARVGGGIRVYLDRPWYSSGAGELLGVTLWNADVPPGDEAREAWKHLITQWGLDPIWAGPPVQAVPDPAAFPDAVATETYLTLDELGSLDPSGQIIYTGTVGVAGHEVQFDEAGQCYCDLRLDSEAYMPFIRLALTRYQPHALPDAKLSRVVLADFVQLAPDRAAVVSADPYRPRRLRVTVSGPGPHAPVTTQITVTAQQRLAAAQSDIAWQDADPATVNVSPETLTPGMDVALWTGTIDFAQPPVAGVYRLLIREYEFIQADAGVTTFATGTTTDGGSVPGRLIYADIVNLDETLVSPPPTSIGGIRGEPGGQDPLGQIVSALLDGGVPFGDLAEILSVLTPTAPLSQPLTGSQDFPCPVSLATPDSTMQPDFGPALDQIVASLLAANVDYDAIMNVIGGIAPTAPPALALAGNQDFPDAVPISTPADGPQEDFGPTFGTVVSALVNAGVDIEVMWDLLAATVPTASPAQSLTGQQDFPTPELPIDTPAPEP